MSIADKLQTIAENEQKVYDKGHADGQQTERERFWDNFLTEDNLLDSYVFSGNGWNNETFKPTKDIIPNTSQLSRLFINTGTIDVKGRLEENGVKLDLSKVRSGVTYICYNTGITRLPELDCRKFSHLQYFVYMNPQLVSIDRVILKDDGSQTFAATSFGTNPKLEQITFEGVIGNSLELKSPLNFESLVSVVMALSTTTTGKTLTLKKSAVDKTWESSEGANDGSEHYKWLNFIDERANWTISLV